MKPNETNDFPRLNRAPRIFPLGETALTVDFAAENFNSISIETNEFVQALGEQIAAANFGGISETAAAYSSLTIFYDVVSVRRANPEFPTAFAAVEALVKRLLPELKVKRASNQRAVRIPICFDAEFALDLEFVAAENNLTAKAVKTIFLQTVYKVFMLGFLPGFAYIGEVDGRIATPRKRTPRALVAPGSVGIANRQTGIYPFASPGGWQIVARTPLLLFDARDVSPTLLQPGDVVRFDEISKQEFDCLLTEKS